METNKNMMNDDEIVIDLKGLFIDLWRKTPLIILIGVITAVLGYAYATFMLTPTYTSSTKMYILSNLNQTSNASYVTDLQIGSLISKDCAELIKSRYVGEQVVEKLELDMTYSQVLGRVNVVSSEDTRIIGIVVTDTSPIRAKQIADTVREVSAEHIQNVMGVEAVNTVEDANIPLFKSGPNVMKYTLMGAVAGLFLMCALFALRYILNDSIRSAEDIENKLGLSVLAVVPVNTNAKKYNKELKKKRK